MNDNDLISAAENAIDSSFGKSPLRSLGYAQAMWTLLSVVEDAHIKMAAIDDLDDDQLSAHIDEYINVISYPMRECHLRAPKKTMRLRRTYNADHYEQAMAWLNLSRDYRHFCSIFSLWHKSAINISASSSRLATSDWRNLDHRYEAYNRVFKKDGRQDWPRVDPDAIAELIKPLIKVNVERFEINFSASIVSQILDRLKPTIFRRYALPDHWRLSKFSMGDYKSIVTIIQSILFAWFIARVMLARDGMQGLGYPSSVWIIKKEKLLQDLVGYSGVGKAIVSTILSYLTFGQAGIRTPDIAIQPLVDLGDENYALSPFVWLHADLERNLCVLLNQIKEERKIYSVLTQEKESLLRKEIRQFLEPLGYEICSAEVDDTDVDTAIIDRKNKTCLCLELKWFIEPAEIRETLQRSEELKKGISQARTINDLFHRRDRKLFDRLSLTEEYDFLAVVGSKSWIGFIEIQDRDVPIIKVRHLLEEIKRRGSLAEILIWLRNRDYLPVAGKDFSALPIEIRCGNLSATWYGIKLL